MFQLEGDGSLVPATDDDFAEVENLLEDDNGELNIVEDPGSSPNEELSSRKPEFVGLEGQHQKPFIQLSQRIYLLVIDYILGTLNPALIFDF